MMYATRRILAATLLSLGLSGTAIAQDGFRVVGSKIYDPSGREFIAKGVNINGVRWVWPGNMTTSEHVPKIIDGFKFNAVRVPVSFEASQWDDNTVESLVQTYTSRGLVVMFDAHDKIGGYFEGTELDTVKDFFRDLATRYKNNPYVWINVQNEPGDANPDKSRWLRVHQEVIKAVRDEAKANNIIVCDGSAWGQDVGEWTAGNVRTDKSAILSYGKELVQFGGKRYDNIVFSVHAYDQWSAGSVAQNRSKMEDFIERVHAQGLALIIGEYGVENANQNTWPGTQGAIAAAQNKEVGRFVWAWWGGDKNDLTTSGNGGGQNLNSLTNPTNLSALGQLVWNDNRRSENLETLQTTGTPTPSPTATRTPAPTATPVPTVRPTMTPQPTATMRPTSTPVNTPQATATPQVTATPRATSTPAPTVSPTASPTTGEERYEAESGNLTGCRPEAKFSGFSGEGYVDWVKASGESIEWNVSSPSERKVELSFRYANGGRYARPLRVMVNGQRIRSLSFSPTGGWTNWGETRLSRKVTLRAGNNNIKILSAGWSGPNIDLLKIK